MNPLFLRWGIIAVVVALLAAFAYRSGHSNGVDSQKVFDQAQFDTINSQLAHQKVEANAKLQAALEANIRDVVAHDTKLKELSEQHLVDAAATAALGDKLATVGLRFRPAEATGCRVSSVVAAAAQGSSPGAPQAVAMELPTEITTNLRQLARTADELRDNYAVCYAYVNR